MNKIVIDLAFASETCCYSSGTKFSQVIQPGTLNNILAHIYTFIGENRTSDAVVFIERPLQIGSKDTIEKFDYLCQSIRQFCKEHYLNCYTIDVGVWQNAIAKLLGYDSKINYDANNISVREDLFDWMTKGYKQSKVMAMDYFKQHLYTPEMTACSEDLIDCMCIAEVAEPHMDGMAIKQQHVKAKGRKVEKRADKKLEIWKRELAEAYKWVDINITYKDCAYLKGSKTPNKNAEKAMNKIKEKLEK